MLRLAGTTTSRFFTWLVAFWLMGIVFAPASEPEQRELIQLLSLVWIFGIGLMWGGPRFLVGPVLRQRPIIIGWLITTLTMITAGSLLSEYPQRSLGYVATVAIGLCCCAGLWEWIGVEVEKSLALFGLLGTALVAYLYATYDSSLERRLSLSASTHANHLGLVCLGILMASLAMKNRYLGLVSISVNLLGIVATQSRGALVAALIGLSVFGSVRLTRKHKVRSTITLLGAAVLASGLLLIYHDEFVRWTTAILFLDHRYRGLGTGFTGRLDAWQEALSLFRDNLWFGVGFRLHERYMTILNSAHSGYFSLLAETGLLGAISVIGLTAGCSRRLWILSMKGDRVATIGLALLAGYLFFAAFERYFLNMGNPTSVLVWLFLLMPTGRHGTVTTPEHRLGCSNPFNPTIARGIS